MPVYASSADGRAIFTVTPHEGGWAVMFEGAVLDPNRNREEVLAAAHRRARACHDGGRAAQVNISGEASFAEHPLALRKSRMAQAIAAEAQAKREAASLGAG